MANVIKIDSLPLNYKERIESLHEFLNEFQEGIFTQMLDIASAGVWKEWMQTIKAGELFNFNNEMLENTNDKNIEILWELYYKIEEIKPRIKP